MTNFNLIPYGVRVRIKSKQGYLDVLHLPGQTTIFTLNDIFIELSHKFKVSPYMRTGIMKTLTVNKTSVRTDARSVSGIVKSGEYGFEADFYDTKYHKHLSSARKEEHSEELPFYFFYCSPSRNMTRGYLIANLFNFETFK